MTNVERRLFIGLGILAFAALLELVLFLTPVDPYCRAGGQRDDPLVWAALLSIPIFWGIALVLLIWGRDRPWGLVRFFGLLGVASLLPGDTRAPARQLLPVDASHDVGTRTAVGARPAAARRPRLSGGHSHPSRIDPGHGGICPGRMPPAKAPYPQRRSSDNGAPRASETDRPHVTLAASEFGVTR
jgi:hypothetical protein